jgi:hypothetical protein
MNTEDLDYLSNFREVFGLFYLLFNNQSEIDLHQVLVAFNQIYKKNFTQDQLVFHIQKFMFTFALENSDMRNMIDSLNRQIRSFLKHLYPPLAKCIECGLTLKDCSSKHKIVCYYVDGPQDCFIHSRECKNCNITYGIDKYRVRGTTFFYSSSIETEFVQTTSETMFHKRLMHEFDEHFYRNAISFSG